MKGWVYLAVFILCVSWHSCVKNESEVTLEVEPVAYTDHNVPVHAPFHLPQIYKNVPLDHIEVKLHSTNNTHHIISGQITTGDEGQHELWWILPETKKGSAETWEAVLHHKDQNTPVEYSWKDTPGKHLDLVKEGKKVFRYEYELDSSLVKGETLTARNKVFYHVFDLAGENLITNGYEEGVWSHHRGIMIGWRDVGYNGQELSFWGMEDLTTQKHMEFLEKTAGPVVSRVKSVIHWDDSTGQTIIKEIRTATIFNQSDPGLLLLDFDSKLTAANGPVSLDGDPEHAGVQFRASNDVAAEKPGSKKPVYLFHEKNIDPKKDHNLPWVGMTYELNNKTYSVVEMDGGQNPKPAIWSAYRDYGRFGPYISQDLTDGATLKVDYRFWISESSMPIREKVSAKYHAYRQPPIVQVQ